MSTHRQPFRKWILRKIIPKSVSEQSECVRTLTELPETSCGMKKAY